MAYQSHQATIVLDFEDYRSHEELMSLLHKLEHGTFKSSQYNKLKTSGAKAPRDTILAELQILTGSRDPHAFIPQTYRGTVKNEPKDHSEVQLQLIKEATGILLKIGNALPGKETTPSSARAAPRLSASVASSASGGSSSASEGSSSVEPPTTPIHHDATSPIAPTASMTPKRKRDDNEMILDTPACQQSHDVEGRKRMKMEHDIQKRMLDLYKEQSNLRNAIKRAEEQGERAPPDLKERYDEIEWDLEYAKLETRRVRNGEEL